jgi:microcystin degradation protein MlrC
MGPAAWIRAGGVDLVLTGRREQVFGTDLFSNLGLDPAARRLVVVKSTQHFHASFAAIADQVIYVSTPGAIAPDFAAIPYTKRDANYWPKVRDPLGLG